MFKATMPLNAHAFTRPWPYPFWIAHRGAGTLAPENTVPAFALGAAHGWRMFECDAKLSRDGQVFLLHDDTLERTTNGGGLAGDYSMDALARLDAGSWHSPVYAGAAIPRLAALVAAAVAQGWCLNVEIKPTPGQEWATGVAVAQLLVQQWSAPATAHAPPWPLLSSFAHQALLAAQHTAPGLPRALLLDWNGDFDQAVRTAQVLDCQAMVLHQRLCTPARIAAVHAQDMRCLAFTVNQPQRAAQLWGDGIDGLISDHIQGFNPQRLPFQNNGGSIA